MSGLFQFPNGLEKTFPPISILSFPKSIPSAMDSSLAKFPSVKFGDSFLRSEGSLLPYADLKNSSSMVIVNEYFNES